jgi:hypothetical protein
MPESSEVQVESRSPRSDCFASPKNKSSALGRVLGACSLVWIGHRVPNPVVGGSNPPTPEALSESSWQDQILSLPALDRADNAWAETHSLSLRTLVPPQST